MKIKGLFEPKRFLLLLRNDLMTHFKTSLIIIGSIIGALSFLVFLANFNGSLSRLHLESFKLVIIPGGYLLTAASFRFLHEKNRSSFYLTLPASHIEKLLSRLVLTTIGFVVGVSALYYVFSLLASGASVFINGDSLPVFNPFEHGNIVLISFYWITQSVFLLGAIHFRSHHFIKTIFSLWLFIAVIIIFTIGVVWLAFDVSLFGYNQIYHLKQLGLGDMSQPVFRIMKMLIVYGIAPFFWLISYLKLKEYEV